MLHLYYYFNRDVEQNKEEWRNHLFLHIIARLTQALVPVTNNLSYSRAEGTGV
jgi:hypothetical protein